MATLDFYDDFLDHYIFSEGNYERCKRMITCAYNYKYISNNEYQYLMDKLKKKHSEAVNNE